MDGSYLSVIIFEELYVIVIAIYSWWQDDLDSGIDAFGRGRVTSACHIIRGFRQSIVSRGSYYAWVRHNECTFSPTNSEAQMGMNCQLQYCGRRRQSQQPCFHLQYKCRLIHKIVAAH